MVLGVMVWLAACRSALEGGPVTPSPVPTQLTVTKPEPTREATPIAGPTTQPSAHPGVEKMAERALDAVGGPLLLVLGGFHLGNAGSNEIEAKIAALQALSVVNVAPTHCTGARARSMFADAYPHSSVYHSAGVGAAWTFDAPRLLQHQGPEPH
jgi:hypothetical protein